MRSSLPACICAMLLAFTSGAARAVTCYQLYDPNDNVIYRSTFPPVDMSTEGDAAREALRARHQYLMFTEFEKCPEVEFRFGEGGSRDLSIENVIGGIAPMRSSATPGPSVPAAPATPAPPRRR